MVGYAERLVVRRREDVNGDVFRIEAVHRQGHSLDVYRVVRAVSLAPARLGLGAYWDQS